LWLQRGRNTTLTVYKYFFYETITLLLCFAAYICSSNLSTFRDSVSVLQGSCAVQEIFPEEGRSHLYSGGNLKSLIVYEDCSSLFNIISYRRDQREVERFEKWRRALFALCRGVVNLLRTSKQMLSGRFKNFNSALLNIHFKSIFVIIFSSTVN
jgi:hypothetical protein